VGRAYQEKKDAGSLLYGYSFPSAHVSAGAYMDVEAIKRRK